MSDIKLVADPELEWEADHSGVIHLRKHPGNTQFLEGYGTTEFGVKSYEPRRRFTAANILLGTGLAVAGLFSWKYKDQISSQAQTIADYGLLLRESLRS